MFAVRLCSGLWLLYSVVRGRCSVGASSGRCAGDRGALCDSRSGHGSPRSCLRSRVPISWFIVVRAGATVHSKAQHVE